VGGGGVVGRGVSGQGGRVRRRESTGAPARGGREGAAAGGGMGMGVRG
jgi:hypothetical protein